MKKLIGFVMLAVMALLASPATARDSSYQTLIYTEQGGAKQVISSGGAVEFEAGSTLTLASTSSLIQTNVDLTEKSVTATYGLVGATLTTSGAALVGGTLGVTGASSLAAVTGTTADFSGNAHFGAAGYISTFTAASGNIAAGGAISAVGAIAAGGALSGTNLVMSGTIAGTSGTFVGGVTISTSATSSLQCILLGAVVSLPTGTYHECDKVYQISDHTLYIATETVKAATSWKAVW